jgi:hypothetical protein
LNTIPSATPTPASSSTNSFRRSRRASTSPPIPPAEPPSATARAPSRRSRSPGSGPIQFRKVISHIGSYTNIRGGYVYPGLIRKTKPAKPLRIFLQDGANDLDNLHGNWPLANQDMAAALKFAGYDHTFVFGDGAHSGKHGGAIFPDTLRWLWRDWPKQ